MMQGFKKCFKLGYETNQVGNEVGKRSNVGYGFESFRYLLEKENAEKYVPTTSLLAAPVANLGFLFRVGLGIGAFSFALEVLQVLKEKLQLSGNAGNVGGVEYG